MPRRCRALLTCTLLAVVLLAATARADLTPQTIAAINTVVSAEMKKQQIVGLAVGVITHDEVAWTRGWGFADRESRIPVTDETLFRWASISKPLTAVAALQLAEQDRLDLDADIRVLVPEFPDKTAPITMRRLLGHLGGIVHYRNGPVIQTRREYDTPHPYQDVVLALDRFKESPLVAEPGTTYAYSTHGYILASAVVQRAGKAPFADQVRTRIAEPLGMTTLRPDYQWQQFDGRAKGYRRRLGLIVESSDTDVSWKLGGGGWVSNIDDLARFAAALLTDKLFSADTRAVMWTPQKTSNGETTTYGLGIGVSGEGEDLRIGHSGAQEKTRTLMVLRPRRHAGLVLMTNSEHADVRAVARAIESVLDSQVDASEMEKPLRE